MSSSSNPFEEGNILYFTPFHFKNGNTPKNKYFVVVKQKDAKLLLASLPSSKDFVPSSQEKKFGCIEMPNISFSCFIIPAFHKITQCEKHFPLETFLYGQQLDLYDIEQLSTAYAVEGIHYEVFGKMKEDAFKLLKECFKSSAAVKMKYIRILEAED